MEFWLIPREERVKKSSTFTAFYEQIIPTETARSSAKPKNTSNTSNPLSNLTWLNKRKIFDQSCITTSNNIAAELAQHAIILSIYKTSRR